MAEQANSADGNQPTDGIQVQTASTADNGESQGAGDEKKQFNIEDLPKEAWDAIYKSGRFKELNEKAKLAEQFQKEKQQAEEAAKKEEGKWQELYEAKEQEVKQWTERNINAEIKAFAAKFGAHDINDVAALADKSGVNLDDNGNVVGAEDAVKALFESKPHLFNNQPNTTKVGSGTNPGDATNQGIPKYTLSEIQSMSTQEYNEKKAEIQAAIASGNVVDDRKR